MKRSAAQMYADMQAMIHDESGIGIPFFMSSLDGHNKKLKGLSPIPLGGMMGYSFAETSGSKRESGMNRTILKLVAGRIVAGLGSLLAVSAVVFAITGVLPGDAAQEKLGQEATPETLAALRKEMGLDRSAVLRYFDWLGGMVTGDPGKSVVTGMPVAEAVESRAAEFAAARGGDDRCSPCRSRWAGHPLRLVARLDVRPRSTSMTAVAVVCVPEFLVATLAVLSSPCS